MLCNFLGLSFFTHKMGRNPTSLVVALQVRHYIWQVCGRRGTKKVLMAITVALPSLLIGSRLP